VVPQRGTPVPRGAAVREPTGDREAPRIDTLWHRGCDERRRLREGRAGAPAGRCDRRSGPGRSGRGPRPDPHPSV